MEGIIFDIKRFALHDGPGIRTTVFFKGCPMRCWWCHNPEGIDPESTLINKEVAMGEKRITVKQELGKAYTVEALVQELEKDRVFMDESNGGITLSGGEPLLQHEFIMELLPILKQRGFHVTIDTCGYVNSVVMAASMPFADLYLFDIKHMNESEHLKYTGAMLSTVLKNLRLVADSGGRIRVRIPYIPSINGTDEIAVKYLSTLQPIATAVDAVDILPYHKIAANKYVRFNMENKMDGIAEPDEEQTNAFAEVFRNAGYKVTIGG
ncbi:MAG: glycyl-radical enzyme activating protein [Marinilabiliales bacterium]|nr:MAG: glycyl-radical enzyme activating protein [Marinilabiliales bacterium]